MQRQYSRLASVEEKKNVRNAMKFGTLTVVAMVILVFFGIPVLGRFAGFITDLAKSEKPIGKNDNTPPAPPQIDNFSEFTNQEIMTLEGRSEESATIKLTFNDSEKEVVAGQDGSFTFKLDLQKGENTFQGKAVDTSGNESQETKVFTIVFDNEKPELEIESPSSGSQFYGSHQRQLTIKGKTEADVQLTINGRFVAVDSDGIFEFTTTLGEGENKFNLKSTDQAGNQTEMDFTASFTP